MEYKIKKVSKIVSQFESESFTGEISNRQSFHQVVSLTFLSHVAGKPAYEVL